MNVKDRLTAHNKAGQGIINMDGVSDVLEASARIRTFSPLIISKLTEYEDTGLSPNEIERLKSENASLRERLEKAVELPCELGSHLFTIEKRYEFITYGAVQYSVENIYCAGEIVVCEDGLFRFYTPTYHPRCLVFGKDIFTTREAAEARLAELKGEQL